MTQSRCEVCGARHCKECVTPTDNTNVVKFNGYTLHSLDPNEMLREIAKEEMDGVFLIVQRKEGLSFHSNFPDSNLALRLVEEFKFKLMSGDFS